MAARSPTSAATPALAPGSSPSRVARAPTPSAVRYVAAGSSSAPLSEATVEAMGTAPDGALGTELDAVIATLDDDQRAAFVLTQVLGYSYADAADVCGVPVGTIRSRVARAREHLVDAVRAEEAG